MSKLGKIIGLLLLLTGCGNTNEEQLYSKEFLKYVQDGGIELRDSHMTFPDAAGGEVVIIPNELKIGAEYSFESAEGDVIQMKRLNYTSYQYYLKTEFLVEKGTVALSPYFQMGAEFMGENELIVKTILYPEKSGFSGCLSNIGIVDPTIEKGPLRLFVSLNGGESCGGKARNEVLFTINKK